MRTKHFRMQYVAALLFLLTLVGVAPLPETRAQELPTTPRRLVKASIENWNLVYGTHVKAVTWSYEGTIRSEEQRNQILAEMTDPKNAWFPSGDVTRPREMSALRIIDGLPVEAEALIGWQNMVRQRVRVGHHIARIHWTKDSQPFTSICIADENELIYDTMLFNAVLVAHHSRCFDYRIGWIWQTKYEDMTRGRITADLNLQCDPDGKPIVTSDGECHDYACDAAITLGEAKIECTSEPVGNCCVLKWAYAWACGFKTAKVKKIKVKVKDKVEVEVDGEIEGYLGSSGMGKGSCKDCCPAPKKARVVAPQPELPMTPTLPSGGNRPSAPPPGAPTPPTDRSQAALSGKAQVFVAGEVSAEEPMLVTVRGPHTLEGMVVSAEVDGKKVEAHTDRKGHALIDFAGVAVGVAGATVAAIRVADSDGKEIAQAQTRVTPGTPGAPAPPQVPKLPPLLRNGGVVTLPGKNLGAQAHLVVGNHAQETLAASSKELTAFVDTPATGPQSAYVLTPQGQSESQTVHCYNFQVTVSQHTIVRGQRIVAVAQYEGLPPGSEIVFTNASPTVVTMKVLGAAQNLGEKSVVEVSQPSGSLRVELIGKTKGAFIINYEVRPPAALTSLLDKSSGPRQAARVYVDCLG